MKKIISVLLTTIIILFTTMANVGAQSFGKGVAVANIKYNPALATYVNENSAIDKSTAGSTKEGLKAAETELKASKANLKALKANFRAARHFEKTFKDAPEATWNVEEQAIVASFKKDDIKTSVVYDKKGTWIHTLSYFPGEKTPDNIRTTVEGSYPNADITLAVQVKEGDLEFYIVQLEDKKTFKQVGVYNGETNLIKEFIKSR